MGEFLQTVQDKKGGFVQLASIPPLIGALVFVALGLIVFANRPWTRASIGYMIFAGTTVWWQGCWTILLNATDPAWAFLVVRIGYSGIIFLPVSFFHFCMEFVEPGRHMRALRWHYAIGFGFLVLLWTTTLFIKGCRHFSWGYYPRPGMLYPLFLTHLTYLSGAGILLLSRHLNMGVERSLRTPQLKFVLVANVIYLFAVVDFVVKYGANFYPFGVVFCIISSGIIAFAILRYRLLDMNAASQQGLLYGLIAIAVGAPLALLVWHLTNPLAKAAAGFLGPVVGGMFLGALKGPLAKVVDRLPLFRGRCERLNQLEVMKQSISKEESEGGWAKGLGRAIAEVLGPCEASILFYDKITRAYVYRSGSRGVDGVPLSAESAFVKVLSRNTILIRDLLDNMLAPDDVEVSRVGMKMIGAEVCIPIFGAEGDMVAVMSVGEKKGGGVLSDLDVTMLWGLARVAEEALRGIMAREEIVKKERLAAIGEMASVVSHEVRTPLAVIQNSAHFLTNRLGEGGDEKMRKHLGIIGAQTEALNTIVKGILDFSGTKELQLERRGINELVEEVVGTIPRPEGVEIRLKLFQGLPEAMIDRGELRQALTNVLNNAMEAMPQGGWVEIATGMTHDGKVSLSVSDSGVGIAAEHLPRIFEPFYTTRGGGTGLGLAVVKKVVERHRGEVRVESVEGKGTTVMMTFPVNGGKVL